MPTFTFHIARPGAKPATVIREIADEHEAVQQAKKIAGDWPDAPTVDLLSEGRVIHRVFNSDRR